MRSAVLAVVAVALLPFAGFAQGSLPSLSDPTISPDGREISFVSGGDIWSVPAAGGEAHLLVTNPATESRPLYSPDGKKLAFVSTRTGSGDIYILTLATGELERLTYSDTMDSLDGWSADGQWIYFTSAKNDISGQGDIFRVRATGGTPLEVSRERYLNEFESAPSPNGQEIALMARGISSSQWWRNGHAHIDETEIWLKPVAGEGGYRKLIDADAKHAWPMWSNDGKNLYFMSDKSGAENIWEAPMGSPESAKALTHFTKGRVLWPSIGAGGKTIVFERDFAIWSVNTATGKAEKVPIELRGAPASPGETWTTESTFRGLALAPDGKKLAVVAHGQMFAASVKEGGAGLRMHSEATAASEAVWSPDSTAVVYVAERADGSRQLELYDFKAADGLGEAKKLTAAKGDASGPMWAPDGKSLVYVQDMKELHLLTPGAKGAAPTDKVLVHGELERTTLAWSPDSQWVAFTQVDRRSFRNVWVVPAAGGEAKPISFLANGETGDRIAWSPDGKYLLFDTAQRSEEVHIARVDLLPHVPKFREDEFRELFKPGRQPGQPMNPGQPAPGQPTPNRTPELPGTQTINENIAGAENGEGAPPAKKPAEKKPEPVKIDFDGIRERLTILPLGLGAAEPVISPDGKTLLFEAESAGVAQLYTWSLDELAREPAVAKQLTSTPGRKADYAFSPDSKEVVYLENGGVRTIALESRTPKPIAVTARVEVDFAQEKHVVFEEAWSILNERFWNPDFNGHDWRALHDAWEPYVAGAQTPDELRRDINLLIGELNSSHSGIGAPRPQGTGSGVQVGNLGLRFDRERYEAGDGLVVREVIALGPAAIEGTIKPGDKIVSVNGAPVGAHDLDQMLEDTVGHRVALGVETAGKTRQAIVRPVSTGSATGLLYRQWVESRRALVEKVSGGKVGYVHMQAMGDDNLQQLYLDLDAQNESKQAVIVDIRNNNGGYVNGYAVDVFTRRNYLEMTPRNMTTVPSRQDLGQRALGLPTALVTNESTLSDGEDFTEGYRTLKLGKTVGQPTAGWIVFTGGTTLIDGSSLRLPFVRVQDTRGETMEMHPRPVDVEVARPLGETETGKDAQLERAVEVLLGGK